MTYLGKRLLLAIPTVLIVAILTFFLVQLVPGDPATFILGQAATPAAIAALHAQLGLDKPVVQQFFSWLGNALTGDFGTSFQANQPVTSTLAKAIPPTFSVALLATVFSLLLGVTLGMAGAIKGGASDRAIQAICSFLLAVPNFWLAALLVLGFAIKMRFFPATDYISFTTSPSRWISHLVLPLIAVGLPMAAQIMFQSRASVLEVLSQDFVRSLQANGISRRKILFKHVLRNAAVPVTTSVGIGFVFTLGGIVVIEAIFNLNGLGTLMLNAVRNHDLVVVQGAVICFTVMVVLVNLVTDLVIVYLDPRVRTQ